MKLIGFEVVDIAGLFFVRAILQKKRFLRKPKKVFKYSTFTFNPSTDYNFGFYYRYDNPKEGMSKHKAIKHAEFAHEFYLALSSKANRVVYSTLPNKEPIEASRTHRLISKMANAKAEGDEEKEQLYFKELMKLQNIE